MSFDWVGWHKSYELSPTLQARLALAQYEIANVLSACPHGRVRLVSMCAGDGRDVIGALANHPRRASVQAHLIELDAALVAHGQAVVTQLQLEAQVEFHCADATVTDTYQSVVPADILLVSGVFGNLRPEEVERLIKNFACLCRGSTHVIWTHHIGHPRNARQASRVRKLFAKADFCSAALVYTNPLGFVLGTHVFRGEPRPLTSGTTLFEFTGFQTLNEQEAAQD